MNNILYFIIAKKEEKNSSFLEIRKVLQSHFIKIEY